MLYKRGLVESFLPYDNTIANNPSGATAWAWPANYTQIIASVTSDWVLVGAYCMAVATVSLQGIMTVGIGAAGSEVEIARGGYGLTCSGTSMTVCPTFYLPFAPRFIPAGSRLACRHSSSFAGQVIGKMYLVGYIADEYEPYRRLPYDLQRYRRGDYMAVNPCLPDRANTTLTSGTPAYNWGSYVSFLDPAPYDLLIRSVVALPGYAAIPYIVEVASGPTGGGGEVPRARVVVPYYTAITYLTNELIVPIPTLVKKGERVSLRTKCNGSSKTIDVMLCYSELQG